MFVAFATESLSSGTFIETPNPFCEKLIEKLIGFLLCKYFAFIAVTYAPDFKNTGDFLGKRVKCALPFKPIVATLVAVILLPKQIPLLIP